MDLHNKITITTNHQLLSLGMRWYEIRVLKLKSLVSRISADTVSWLTVLRQAKLITNNKLHYHKQITRQQL